jgi:hypothetical protein
VTIEHPDALEVTPDNIEQHAVGFATNIRRGSPPGDGLVLAGLVITHRKGIDAMRSGIRALSRKTARQVSRHDGQRHR